MYKKMKQLNSALQLLTAGLLVSFKNVAKIIKKGNTTTENIYFY